MSANGRPTRHETRARTRDFLRHLAAGVPTLKALRDARVDPERFARLLTEDDEFWQAYRALRDLEEIARAA